MNKFTISVIVVILAAFGGLIAWQTISTKNSSQKLDLSSVDSGKIIAGNDLDGGIGDHVRGNAESSVVVVEYADFECSACASMYSHIEKVYKKYNKDAAFVFRNFPLKMHQNARAASAAAEAAGKQGFYWEMNEALFTNRSSWVDKSGNARTESFVELFAGVASPDVNLDQFRSDLSSEDVLKKIDFDYNLGLDIDKVSATPSIFVNGVQVPLNGNMSFTDVENAVMDMIEKGLKGEEITPNTETKSEEKSETEETKETEASNN